MSDFLKAVLVTEDMMDGSVPVYQSNCLTVQQFSYSFEHPCNSWGIPFDTTKNTVLTTQLKLFKEDDSKLFIALLSETDCHDFTFLFNASFDEDRRVKDYDDAMRVKGMVVDVDENFETAVSGGNQQMLLTVKILVSSVTYNGSMTDKTLQISVV